MHRTRALDVLLFQKLLQLLTSSKIKWVHMGLFHKKNINDFAVKCKGDSDLLYFRKRYGVPLSATAQEAGVDFYVFVDDFAFDAVFTIAFGFIEFVIGQAH